VGRIGRRDGSQVSLDEEVVDIDPDALIGESHDPLASLVGLGFVRAEDPMLPRALEKSPEGTRITNEFIAPAGVGPAHDFL